MKVERSKETDGTPLPVTLLGAASIVINASRPVGSL